MPRLTFHGAAETVTGSKYLLQTDGGSALVDCGLFQGLKRLRLLNWEPPPFEPEDVDAVVLTHAHIDHIGYLPRFVGQGFRKPVYCTPATERLAELLLFDAAKIQEADAEYANRKGFSKHRPALPLFDTRDAARALNLLKPVERGEWFGVSGPLFARYHDAGHLLGSAWLELEDRSEDPPLRLLFSGDVGRYDAPLYHDPAPPADCDYLICESTYGDRDHNADDDLLVRLEEVVNASARRGGVLLVAAFAVGRSQQLIYLLRLLIEAERIPELPIFLDSPMAISATEIFCEFAADHDLSEGELTGAGCVFTGRNVHLARTVEESKRINRVDGPAVIISSSGMMTGGRILHHLRKRLPDASNTVLLAGFQAEGTRGWRLKNGERTLRMHGQDVPVRAAIEEISGLSAHAGRSELLRWLAPLESPRRVFITHGEKEAARALAEELESSRDWNVAVPKLGESFTLS